MTTKNITARLDALKLKSDAEDERDRFLALGADPDSSDLHARAMLALSERGIHSPTADEYVQAVDLERRADEPDTPASPRLDHDVIHAEAIKVLASRGVDKPNFTQYSDALTEVAGG